VPSLTGISPLGGVVAVSIDVGVMAIVVGVDGVVQSASRRMLSTYFVRRSSEKAEGGHGRAKPDGVPSGLRRREALDARSKHSSFEPNGIRLLKVLEGTNPTSLGWVRL
jgi:hypothetical protein